MATVNFAALRAMSEENLRELNSAIVSVINERIRARQRDKMSEFHIGQHAAFRSKTGRLVTIRITKMNQKTVSGFEVAPDGSVMTMNTWRVTPSLLRHVEV